jgi:NAD(P)-dependent dehydrogenase (short-subunit alcohol dehydrogenase family)
MDPAEAERVTSSSKDEPGAPSRPDATSRPDNATSRPDATCKSDNALSRPGDAPSRLDSDVSRSQLFRPSLLDGQVAIVTGGGSGLGRETALELARCGARVVICGRREEPLLQTVAADPHGLIESRVCDIREEHQVEGMVDGVLAAHGQIDLLLNNAGGQFLAPAESITPKGFRTVIRLNVEGTWLMTHAVATKAMIPSGRGGKIFSVTLSPHSGMPGMAHSGAARAAVENLMSTLAVEWARFGIRLLALAAGQFETQTLLTKYPQAIVERIADTIPLGRMGSEKEFAWLVAYLASPAGDFFSGAVITMDGARDNWLGPWPPRQAADEQGTPLSEQRRG